MTAGEVPIDADNGGVKCDQVRDAGCQDGAACKWMQMYIRCGKLLPIIRRTTIAMAVMLE